MRNDEVGDGLGSFGCSRITYIDVIRTTTTTSIQVGIDDRVAIVFESILCLFFIRVTLLVNLPGRTAHSLP